MGIQLSRLQPFLADLNHYPLDRKCVNRMGTWTFTTGIIAPSDSRLKDDVRDLPSEECLEVLRQVSAKSYVRNDLPATSRRIGFIAQEAEAALGSSIAGTNVIGKMTREVPGGTEDLKTLSYERMSVILWQCTRSLLARVEALEAKLAQ